MVTISAPLASAGDWVNNPAPGGTTIDVIAGEDFLIRHVLEWNETENGAYTVTVGWYNYDNKPEENLTFVSASATFTSGDNVGESIRADVILTSAPSGANTAWALAVECPSTNKDPRDGVFNVDIILGAYGVGGVPHISGDHVIPLQLGGVIVTEALPLSWNRTAITIRVTGVGVTVDITPASDNGWTGEDLTYTVTVTNTGELADTYNLSADDTLGWTLDVTPGTLSIPAGLSDTATLTVTVGAGTDTITVTAVGDYASDSDTCTATQKEGYNVDVSISPLWDEALPGEILYYEVVIKNTGTENDNYDIAISETETWEPHFSPDFVSFPPTDDACPNTMGPPPDHFEMFCGLFTPESMEGTVYFKFDLAANIPPGSTITNATLSFVMVDAVFPVAGGTISIGEVSDDSWTEETLNPDPNSPDNPELGPEITTVGYTVEEYSRKNVDVTLYIESEFNIDGIASLWVRPIEDMQFIIVPSKEGFSPDDRPYLEVTYEAGPPPEPTVTTTDATGVTDTQATLNADFTVGDYASVDVWFQYRVQGETTWIETTHTTCTASGSHSDDATGLSYETTYEFRAALQYNPENIYGDTLIFETSTGYTPPAIQPGENITLTLTVEIPLDAVPCTTNYITVTATSQCDPTVSDSDTCQAHVEAAVEVDVLPIDPQWQERHANKELQYFVTIVNEGAALDTFDVVLTDTLGWNPTWDITTRLLPTDDGAAVEAFPDSVEDGGVNYNTYNGWSATYLSQRPYFKFDISAVPHGSWIKSATLWACGKHGPSAPDYTPTWHLVDAMSVDDDSWDEMTLTWNNAPPLGSVLDTDNFASKDFVGEWNWLSWDVTDFVVDEFYVNQLVSIALKRQDPEDAYESSGWFRTKDYDSYWAQFNAEPYLEITYMSDTTEITLDNGESVTLGFGVVVPADVIPSVDTDIITVTATSQTDGSVTDSESAEAHAGLMRGVEASIVGPASQETYKDPLTYVVKIHNTGQIADMYKLTAYDKRGWPLRIEPQEIYLKPSHSAQAALSVTIPYQTPGSTVDDIWVVIQGKLASGTFSDPENVQARVDVQAHQREVWGVDVEVYPSIHQTGHPGSPLTWLVTVTNTGNMPDSYTLDLSQNVYDANRGYDDWVGELTQYTVELGQGEEESILLNLLVDKDLRTGVHNDILVEATSEMAYDNASVTAQVRQQMPHVPQGEIKLQAVAGYVAIDIWPTYHDFGVLNEMEERATPPDYFTVRNVGNVYVDVTIVGMDATSKPGEPAAKWALGDGAIGVDMYALWWTSGGEPVDSVTKDEKELIGLLAPSGETQFDLMIQAPSTFTTPAKMWMKVAITARKLHPQP